MTRRWADAAAVALLAATACVSYDPAGPVVPDVTGAYSATIALSISNEFETRSDTLAAALALRNTGNRGIFVGTYAIAASDSGPVEGSMAADGSLIVSVFGPPPKPVAAVASIRRVYPWCDWALLGMPPVRGSLAGDTLRATVQGSVPCLYQVNGMTRSVYTTFGLALTGVR
jgi:hypothetical protein